MLSRIMKVPHKKYGHACIYSVDYNYLETSMQEATKNFYNRELVAQPLRLEVNFAFPLGHKTELMLLE